MMKQENKKESPLLNLGLNLIAPTVILMKFSSEEYLGTVNGLIVALSFPIGYGVYGLVKEKKMNPLSILGVVSTLLTGVVGLFELDNHWITVKEAAVPLVIGLAVLISARTSYPLIKKMLYNDQLLNTEKIEFYLKQHNAESEFDSRFNLATYMFAGTFFFSSAINYILAKMIVVSPAGTEAFNEEIGKMTGLSFPVIALPTTLMTLGILYYLALSIKKLTGLEFKEVLSAELDK